MIEPSGRYANLVGFRDARYRDSLRAQPDAYRQPKYIRSVDGGVADNIGLTSVRRTLLTPGSKAYLPGLINRGALRRLVIIVVNARSDARNSLDGTPDYTDLLDMASAVSGVLVDRAAVGSTETFRAFITNLAEERNQLLQAGEEKARFDIYPVEVDFDQLPDTTDADRAARDALKSIPTSWTLSAEDGAKLDRAAGELLWRHPCFRDLIRDLRATGTPEAPAVPGAACTAPPPIQAPIQPPGKAK